MVLGSGELPAQATVAVGDVTTLGTVAANITSFSAHSLDEVAGNSALNPQNLMAIVDGATRDPILSAGRKVLGLLQSESAVDGSTSGTATPDRLQISFVRQNATGTDLEAVPVADIAGVAVQYCTRERIRFEDLNQLDFLTGAIVDVGAGAGTIDLQTAFNNQGTTPVNVNTDATFDIGTGLESCWRDNLGADLVCITEGSATGTSEVNFGADVDTFNNDAVVNDFANGATVNSAGTRPVAVGVSDGIIESTAGDLEIQGFAGLSLDDGNRAGSTWMSNGIMLSASMAEWTALKDCYPTEPSFAAMLVTAKQTNGRVRVWSCATAMVPVNTDTSGPATDGNFDVEFGDLSAGVFTEDYDILLNGQYLVLDATAGGNGDVYPGADLALGQLRWNRKINIGDTVTVIRYV